MKGFKITHCKEFKKIQNNTLMVRVKVSISSENRLMLSLDAREFLSKYVNELERYMFRDDTGMYTVYTAILPSSAATIYTLTYT